MPKLSLWREDLVDFSGQLLFCAVVLFLSLTTILCGVCEPAWADSPASQPVALSWWALHGSTTILIAVYVCINLATGLSNFPVKPENASQLAKIVYVLRIIGTIMAGVTASNAPGTFKVPGNLPVKPESK